MSTGNTTNLPNIQGDVPLRVRTPRGVGHGRVQPGVLGARRLEEDVHVRGVTLFEDENSCVVVGVERVQGVRRKDSRSVGQAPV